MTRKLTAVGLVLAAVLLSGCEPRSGGDGNGGARPGPTRLVTPRVPLNPPRPNPDHGPRTPGPIAGDPNPTTHREWSIFVAWSPSKGFVEVAWEVGAREGRKRERSGGSWSEHGTTHAGAGYQITANWTELSYRRNDGGGTIKIVFTIDGKPVCERSTTSGLRSRGVMCAGVVK